jgi:integrase/recombinase XerC
VNFHAAIELYVRDQRAQGRINSDRTEQAYRQVLDLHAADVGNRDPRTTNRDDCKRTLIRWAHPNTLATRRGVLVSFYDWALEEGLRKDNPARQTRRPKTRPPQVYRLTRGEAVAMLNSTQGTLERRVIYLGICAGLRSAELRGLQGLNFQRDGFVHVTAQIAKGNRERWVPIIEELQPVVDEIRQAVAPAHFVLPSMVTADPPFNTRTREVPTQPVAAKTVWRVVGRVAVRAGIGAHVHPHLMRHAFAEHIARNTGLLVAQAMLGHANVGTTRAYVGSASLDEVALAVRGLRFDRSTVSESAIVEPSEVAT